MADERTQSLERLQIPADKKSRRRGGPAFLLLVVAALVVVALVVFALTRHSDRQPVPSRNRAATAGAAPAGSVTLAAGDTNGTPVRGEVVLTVSGYIVPRARIELSPQFMGTVKWIGVKKGDRVRQGDVIVQLEDDEQRARLLEAQGNVTLAQANLRNAETNLLRQLELARHNVDSLQVADDARRARDVAAAQVTVAQGQFSLAQTYLDWCTIRAPIDGVILEKLVDPNELVVPQSFGGARGPSTALVAMADLNDLQIEIDLNEADLSRVRLDQPCRIVPEAYPDHHYQGRVAEIAPEANRQKGTLQVKVQVDTPDQFLTPELTAKVDFLQE